MEADFDADDTTDVLKALALEWSHRYASGVKKDNVIEGKGESQNSLKGTALFEDLKPLFQQSSFQTILVSLLRDVVKPQLSAYKHAKLTDQGTQRIRPRKVDALKDEVDPPAETMSILYWVSRHIELSTVPSNWHLILPPILILLDSSYARVRARATVILSNILERIDEPTLSKTGLAEVIWSAIFPNLTSLPPITEIEDSVLLLRVTYTTLITLAKLWRPALPQRIPLLDNIIRSGVIYAMLFSGDKLKIAHVELESLDLLVKEMGIYFVKHLKHVLPIISSILANPLGSNHPAQLLLSLTVLESIISICWPRIGHHHAEILRGTTTCWRYLRNQDSPDLIPVRDALKRVTQVLISVSPEAEVDAKAIKSIDSYYAELC